MSLPPSSFTRRVFKSVFSVVNRTRRIIGKNPVPEQERIIETKIIIGYALGVLRYKELIIGIAPRNITMGSAGRLKGGINKYKSLERDDNICYDSRAAKAAKKYKEGAVCESTTHRRLWADREV